MLSVLKDNWLTRNWAAHAEKQRIEAHYDRRLALCLRAVQKHSPALLNMVVDKTEVPYKFLEQHFNTILRAAIDTDDITTFEAALNLREGSDINYAFESRWYAGDIDHDDSVHTKTPVFLVALYRGKENIVNYLAEHPDLDLEAGEYKMLTKANKDTHFGIAMHGQKPAYVADRHGFSDVAELLLLREEKSLKYIMYKKSGLPLKATLG